MIDKYWKEYEMEISFDPSSKIVNTEILSSQPDSRHGVKKTHS